MMQVWWYDNYRYYCWVRQVFVLLRLPCVPYNHLLTQGISSLLLCYMKCGIWHTPQTFESKFLFVEYVRPDVQFHSRKFRLQKKMQTFLGSDTSCHVKSGRQQEHWCIKHLFVYYYTKKSTNLNSSFIGSWFIF